MTTMSTNPKEKEGKKPEGPYGSLKKPDGEKPFESFKNPEQHKRSSAENEKNNALPVVHGYGEEFPEYLLETLDVEVRYKESAKKVGLIVSRGCLVLGIYSRTFAGRINLGDYITHINDESIVDKIVIYSKLLVCLKKHETFTIKIKRPRWLVPTTNVPKGYDLAPGYAYFCGLLVLYPNSNIGMNVKAFSSRIYIARVEHDSIASNMCMVGDCIVDVDGCPVTTVNDCSEKILSGLKMKRFVQFTIERAANPITCRAVRCALSADKTAPMDPKMARDSSKIGEDEAARIKTGRVPKPHSSILKSSGSGVPGTSFYGSEKPHMDIKAESVEHTIGCEPCNPLFFHKVKERAKGTPGKNDLDTSSNGSSIGSQNLDKSLGGNSTGGTSIGGKTASGEKLEMSASGTAGPAKKKQSQRSKMMPVQDLDTSKKTNNNNKSSYQNVDEKKEMESARNKKSAYGTQRKSRNRSVQKNKKKSLLDTSKGKK